jgi:hypothetical protein
MYGPVIGQSPLIDELFSKLRDKVQYELEIQSRYLECVGLLETIILAAQH